MEESFLTTENEDGTKLTQWKDINPQTPQKYFAVKTASTSGVYKDSSPIGSLPSVYFDGSTTNHYFTLFHHNLSC
ncbi:MAG: hypothetical protein KGQ36_02850 [Rickettsiales bacterium]|nr:hypothetical protein [Rickettsiales bacterium]